ncbi:ribosome small subunit-dependent GTPase A [Desulforhopalus sp. 52FAK]
MTRKGVIVAHYGVAVDVQFADGNKEMVRVKRNSGHVVGDNVIIEDETLIRQERISELARMDARGGVHIVGANLDVLCIVVTCEPLPPPGFIDRAIVAARASGHTPVLVLNKSDLACFNDYEQFIRPLYKNSVDIFSVSAETSDNLEEIKTFFSEGHRGIFVGSTGVGKSSILNKILPEIMLATGEISESKKRGRHTTTVSTLHLLDGGGELVDSPGFNDFGLVDTSVAELSLFFPGFEAATEEPCRFRDCKHHNEPGCSVREALAAGNINPDRYKTYLQILEEVEVIDQEPKYRERRSRRKKN